MHMDAACAQSPLTASSRASPLCVDMPHLYPPRPHKTPPGPSIPAPVIRYVVIASRACTHSLTPRASCVPPPLCVPIALAPQCRLANRCLAPIFSGPHSQTPLLFISPRGSTCLAFTHMPSLFFTLPSHTRFLSSFVRHRCCTHTSPQLTLSLTQPLDKHWCCTYTSKPLHA